jgi:serine protease Do
MRWKTLLLLIGPLAGSSLLAADTLQLKDDATLSGRILVEKPDQVFLDVGYTVLTVPRNQIARIIREEAPPTVRKAKKSSTAPAPLVPPGSGAGFYRPGAEGAERPVRELAGQLAEAVVQVRTPAGLGSGFILNEEGFLVTNFHVIENETQISVEVYHQNGRQLERQNYKQVRIVALNKFSDLALLKIEDAAAPKFVSVPVGDSESLTAGDRVFAIGSPLGLQRTVTEGIVSTKTRPIQGELYLQTTAQINPGNSGGPLFNLRGEVIGVTNMKITFGEGLGFAIPAETLRRFLNHRDAYAYDNENPANPYRYLDPPRRLKNLPTGTGESVAARETDR